MTLRIPIRTSNPLTPPAPAWVQEAATASTHEAAAYASAVESAREAVRARTAATTAFREASVLGRDGYIPRRDLTVDEWRVLQAAEDDAERAVRPAERAVERAWHAYADALADDPGAIAAVESRRADQHRVASEAVAVALDALKAFIEAESLAAEPTNQTTSRVQPLLEQAQAALNPEKRWVTVRSPEAKAFIAGMRK